MTRAHRHEPPDDTFDLLGEDEDQPVVDVPPAEVVAIHTIPGAPLSAVHDPARRESAVGYEFDGPGASWFDDEEPDGDIRERRRSDEETPDLEDLLVTQHYAFEEETDEDEGA